MLGNTHNIFVEIEKIDAKLGGPRMVSDANFDSYGLCFAENHAMLRRNIAFTKFHHNAYK